MKESRTSNSIKNMSANILYQILNIIISFVSRTVFIQVLGVSFLGISGLFNDVLSMLNLADLGFGTVMTYSMYKPLAEKDYDTLAGLTHFYKKVYRLIALVITVIGISLIPFLPHLINLEQDIPHVEIYYLLFLASHVASYLVTYKTVVMYADQKNYIFVKYSAYWSIAQTITLTLILYLTHNYIVFLCGQVLFVYMSNFQKSHVAQKNYPFIGKKIVLPKTKQSEIFKDIRAGFIYKISNVLITATDNALISVLISTDMVGYYSNYQIITSKILNVVNTVFTSTTTSIGNLLSEKQDEKQFQLFKAMQSLSLILATFFATCIFLLEEDFIRIWLGEAFILGTFALFSLVFNFYFSISIIPVVTFREAAGLFRKTRYIMLLTASLNLAFSILLGKFLGLPGILFATSLSKILTLFWYEPKLLFKDYFNKPYIQYFIDWFKGLAITLLTIGVSYLASFWFVPKNWVELILKGLVVAAVSLLMTIICYYRTPSFKLLSNQIKNIFSKFTKKAK